MARALAKELEDLNSILYSVIDFLHGTIVWATSAKQLGGIMPSLGHMGGSLG